jgi:hypothetical protein
MFSKNSRMTLTLLEPNLYIDTDSDSCNVIRGTITFNMEKKTLIRDLLIRFNGKMETKTHRCKCLIIERTNKIGHTSDSYYF